MSRPPRSDASVLACGLGAVLLALVMARSSAAGSAAVFRDVTREAGIDFTHFIGASGEHYMPETIGAGAALFDADGDGDLDLYLVQGAMLGEGKTVADSVYPYDGPQPLTDRLLRNDLPRDAAPGTLPRFTDVTASSGIDERGYGMGVAVGDYDNDGDLDLYVASFGRNTLWRNEGDGTFTDRTREAGADDARWSTTALFFDYDRDGWLDLFIGDYVAFRVAANKRCTAPDGAVAYCAPGSYAAEPDRLLRNRGDGTFEDATGRAGLGEPGNTLGAVAADFDADGWIDLYVAIDQMANQLWMNQGDGTFANEALVRGCGVDRDGRAQASMGVDAGDADGDGDLDLFMTHLGGDTNTLYLNDGSGAFEDRTHESGLGAPSFPYTGWGTALFDYDNDGRLDVLVTNGAVTYRAGAPRARGVYPLDEPDQLFRGRGDGTFEEVSAAAGPAFAQLEVGRGAAFGDVDDDGDVDVVIVNNNGPARLLRNEVGTANAWIGLRLRDRHGRSDVPGAVVRVERAGTVLTRVARGGGSYASAHDPRVLIGLGAPPSGAPETAVQRVSVEVRWPSGRVEAFDELAAGAYHDVVEGGGRARADEVERAP